jgi:hypothetical protein
MLLVRTSRVSSLRIHHLPIVCNLPWQRQRRPFFGVGEIIGVLANPAETIRQLKESKELLAKAQEETELAKEKKQIPKKHTFSKLPGFHGREAEQGMSQIMSIASLLYPLTKTLQLCLGRSLPETHR